MDSSLYKQTSSSLSPKQVAILGSTGSIGTQALKVIAAHPDELQVFLLSGHSNANRLIEQAKLFKPQHVVVTHTELYPRVKEALQADPITVHAGQDALCQLVQEPTVDTVLAAMVGFAGLRSTVAAIKAGKEIALANKETLVVAGTEIISLAKEHNSEILPVDSEHSAIYQCLVGEKNPIEKILLTSSGGPFLHHSKEELQRVTPAEALHHPQWNMGAKITIDSATMMNKGLEMIEACHLFQVPPQWVEIVVHPESKIHSMVQFADGVVKAQLSEPNMQLPIAYALGCRKRLPNALPRLPFFDTTFSFLPPDPIRFPCIRLAYQAMEVGGAMPCILNAANEVANLAFRQERISFVRIPEVIEQTLARSSNTSHPSIESLCDIHLHATWLAESLL